MLRDQFGGVWAKSTVTPDPAWLELAGQHHWVTECSGPWLGVRLPEGKTEHTYTLQDRIAEFRRGREQGLCAAASVHWHPEMLDQTMEWVLFPAGTFGQPYPIAYVPVWNFDHLGGPETFGLKPVTLRGHDIGPVSVAQDLAVDMHLQRHELLPATPGQRHQLRYRIPRSRQQPRPTFHRLAADGAPGRTGPPDRREQRHARRSSPDRRKP